MTMFRKKVHVVEAEMWRGLEHKHDGVDCMTPMDSWANRNCSHCGDLLKTHGLLYAGRSLICPGDWLVKNHQGDWGSYSPRAFEMSAT